MLAWETSVETLELRRKFDDDEDEFEDDGFTFDDDDEDDEDARRRGRPRRRGRLRRRGARGARGARRGRGDAVTRLAASNACRRGPGWSGLRRCGRLAMLPSLLRACSSGG